MRVGVAYVDVRAQTALLDRDLATAESKIRASATKMQGIMNGVNANMTSSSASVTKSFDNIGKSAQSTARSIQTFSSKSKKSMAGLIPHVAAVTASYMAMRAAWRSVTGAILVGSEFEHKMAIVRAITGDLSKGFKDLSSQFDALKIAAKEAGEQTVWTASQASEALKFLAMAGFSAVQSIGALPGVLQLALIGELELGRATDIATDTLNAMRLEVDDLARVNDVFVQTITNTNTNIEQMGHAMKFAAPVAGALGYEIEQLAAMIGIVAQSGVKAGIAGRNLQQAMIRAIPAAEAYGLENAKLIDVLKELNKRQNEYGKALGKEKAATMAILEAKDKFGMISLKTILILKDNIDAYEELLELEMKAAGASKKAADIIESSTVSIFKKLVAAVTSISIDIWERYSYIIGKSLKDATRWILEHKAVFESMISKFISYIPLMLELLATFAAFKIIVKVAGWIKGLSMAFTALAVTTTAANYALKANMLIASLVALNWAFKSLETTLNEYKVFDFDVYLPHSGHLGDMIKDVKDFGDALSYTVSLMIPYLFYLKAIGDLRNLFPDEPLLPPSHPDFNKEKISSPLFEEALDPRKFQEYLDSLNISMDSFYDDLVERRKKSKVDVDPAADIKTQLEAANVALKAAMEEQRKLLTQEYADLDPKVKAALRSRYDELVKEDPIFRLATERAKFKKDLEGSLSGLELMIDEGGADLAKAVVKKKMAAWDKEHGALQSHLEKTEKLISRWNDKSVKAEDDKFSAMRQKVNRDYKVQKEALEKHNSSTEKLTEAHTRVIKAIGGMEVKDQIKEQAKLDAKIARGLKGRAGFEKDYYKAKMNWIDSEAKMLKEKYKDQFDMIKWIAAEEMKLNKEVSDKRFSDMQAGLTDLEGMFSAISGMYEEGSSNARQFADMAKAMTIAQKGLAVVQAVAAIATQGLGDPYTAFARIAAMTAAMVGLLSSADISFSGGGIGDYTGAKKTQLSSGETTYRSYGVDTSVFGGENDEMSKSIEKSTDLLEDMYDLQNNTLTGIHSSMKQLNDNITGIVRAVVHGGGDLGTAFGAGFGESSNVGTGSNNGLIGAGIATGLALATGGLSLLWIGVEALLGGLLGKALQPVTDFFFGTTKTYSEGAGISVSPGSKSVRPYTDVYEKDSGAFFGLVGGGESRYTKEGERNPELENLFFGPNGVYTTLREGMVELATLLGADVQFAANYIFKELKIDFEGKTAAEISEIMSGAISRVGDDMASAVLGDIISLYQTVGEGALETAMRLAVDMAVVTDSIDKLGMSFSGTIAETLAMSESLIKLAGGLDNFVTASSTFFDKFFSDAEKQEMLYYDLTEALAMHNLELPKSRDGYRDLVAAQDLSTEAGQRAYWALVELAGAADQLYTSIDKTVDSLTDLFDRIVDWRQERTRSNWGPDKFIAEFQRLGRELDILNMSPDSETYYDDSINLLEQQFTVLKSIESIEDQTLDALKDSLGTIDDMIESLLMGAGASVESREVYQDKYDQLLAAAMGGDSAAISDLSTFMPKYLDFMTAYKEDSGDITRSILSDLKDLREIFSGKISGFEAFGGEVGDIDGTIESLTAQLVTSIKDLIKVIGVDLVPALDWKGFFANLTIEDWKGILGDPIWEDIFESLTVLDWTTLITPFGYNEFVTATGIDELNAPFAALGTALGSLAAASATAASATEALTNETYKLVGDPKYIPNFIIDNYVYNPDDGLQNKTMASGGLTSGISIAGEAGPEWIVPTMNPYSSKFLRDVGADPEAIGNAIASRLAPMLSSNSQSRGGELTVRVEIDGREIGAVVTQELRSNDELIEQARRVIN